jgi:hypothetical protein
MPGLYVLEKWGDHNPNFSRNDVYAETHPSSILNGAKNKSQLISTIFQSLAI